MTSEAGGAPYHAYIYFSVAERPLALALRNKLRAARPGDPLSELRFVLLTGERSVDAHWEEV